MKAEEIMELVDTYGIKPCEETYQPVLDSIAVQGAERRQLAKECVAVISKPVHFGDWQLQAWCTVCQVKVDMTDSNKEQPFPHKPDCLVAKVEGEG